MRSGQGVWRGRGAGGKRMGGVERGEREGRERGESAEAWAGARAGFTMRALGFPRSEM